MCQYTGSKVRIAKFKTSEAKGHRMLLALILSLWRVPTPSFVSAIVGDYIISLQMFPQKGRDGLEVANAGERMC